LDETSTLRTGIGSRSRLAENPSPGDRHGVLTPGTLGGG